MQVVRPSELGEPELRRWRALQAADPRLRSPFLAPEFALAVDAARDDARVAVLGDGGSATAFFPFSVDASGQGAPLGVSISDAQGLVAPSDLTWDARALVRDAAMVCWRFDHLLVGQRPFAPYHATRHRSPVVDLAGGVDEVRRRVRARSKDVLQQTARRRRNLARDVGEVTFAWHAADPGALDTLLVWKSAQYLATGVWDRFAHAWIVEVVRRLSVAEGDGCTGVLATLHAGDALVAAHFGLLGRDRLAWWFPAYDDRYARYSPGLVLLVDVVEACATRGLALVDLGRGEHHYKLRVATGSYEVAEGVVPAAE